MTTTSTTLPGTFPHAGDARRERANELVRANALRALVQDKLELHWSPLAAWLRACGWRRAGESTALAGLLLG